MWKFFCILIILASIAMVCYSIHLIIKHHSEKEALKHLPEKQKMQSNEIIQIISKHFTDIGWNHWDSSIHNANGQLKRIERAVTENIQLCTYSTESGYAKMKGHHYYLLNQYGCSCQDFRNRQLPCKHMYKLALCLPDYTQYLFLDNNAIQQDLEKYNYSVLYGLDFFITGRHQEDVKQYIQFNGGNVNTSFVEDYNTAVISTDNIETNRISKAKAEHIFVFSFDELKDIFYDIKMAIDDNNAVTENPMLTKLKTLLHEYKKSVALLEKQTNNTANNNVQLTDGELQPIPIEYINSYKSPSGGYVNYAKYQVTGINKTTNKKIRRKFECFSESEAIILAEQYGLVAPFDITPVQFNPPTERQIQYANSLYITIPTNICDHDMSALISRVTEDDEILPDKKTVRTACDKGLKFSRYTGKKALLEMIEKCEKSKKAV